MSETNQAKEGKSNVDDILINSVNDSMCVVEFDMDGRVTTANEKFLESMGYTLEELKGQEHRVLWDSDTTDDEDYKNFWKKLNQGTTNIGDYLRITKDGQEVYLKARYTPILDEDGKPYKVLKIASDVTESKKESLEALGKVSAIDKSLGTVEFDLEGNILTANQNFLDLMGYTLEEVKGKHHHIFCDQSYVDSRHYQEFWDKLGKGEFDSGEYKRVAKHGREVYIQATYNPILDLRGKPYKVVKIASDITQQKKISEERTKQAAMIMEMSTPIMQLWDNVLLMPVIGMVDSRRVQMIMEAVLQKVVDHDAKVIVMDIQGVPTVDSAVANHLLKITKATRLMGCTCIVTGISPVISQAIVNLGIELTDITTQSNLKGGVSEAFKVAGYVLTTDNQ